MNLLTALVMLVSVSDMFDALDPLWQISSQGPAGRDNLLYIQSGRAEKERAPHPCSAGGRSNIPHEFTMQNAFYPVSKSRSIVNMNDVARKSFYKKHGDTYEYYCVVGPVNFLFGFVSRELAAVERRKLTW